MINFECVNPPPQNTTTNFGLGFPPPLMYNLNFYPVELIKTYKKVTEVFAVPKNQDTPKIKSLQDALKFFTDVKPIRCEVRETKEVFFCNDCNSTYIRITNDLWNVEKGTAELLESNVKEIGEDCSIPSGLLDILLN